MSVLGKIWKKNNLKSWFEIPYLKVDFKSLLVTNFDYYFQINYDAILMNLNCKKNKNQFVTNLSTFLAVQSPIRPKHVTGDIEQNRDTHIPGAILTAMAGTFLRTTSSISVLTQTKCKSDPLIRIWNLLKNDFILPNTYCIYLDVNIPVEMFVWMKAIMLSTNLYRKHRFCRQAR